MSVAVPELARLAASVVADMRRFAGLLTIATKSGGYIPFRFDAWNAEQRRYQRERTKRDIVLKPRQIGFSTLELARDVRYALRHKGVQVLICSHDGALCEQMFRDVTRMVADIVKLGIIPAPKNSSVREVVFSHNGSAIRVVEAGMTERVADKRGRSGTIHRLHATEVAFWGAATATFAALLGALSPDGEAVVESTANGASGAFYELAREAMAGRSEWRMHFFAWYDHAEYRRAVPPGFDPSPLDDDERTLREHGCDDEQIAWWRSLLADPARGGRTRIRQEYPIDATSCFALPGGAYLDEESCDWLAGHVSAPAERVPIVVTHVVDGVMQTKRLGDLLVWQRASPGASYVVGADVSEGVAGDESALDVLERRTGRTVATYASNTIEPGDFGLVLAFAGRRYGLALIAPERNNHGHTVLRTLSAEHTSVTPYPRIYEARDGRPGWLTSSATRPPLFDDLAQAVRDRATMSPDAAFAMQSRTLVRGQGGKPAASGKGTVGGARDDRWIARAIAWQLRQRTSADSGPRDPQHRSSSEFDGV